MEMLRLYEEEVHDVCVITSADLQLPLRIEVEAKGHILLVALRSPLLAHRSDRTKRLVVALTGV